MVGWLTDRNSNHGNPSALALLRVRKTTIQQEGAELFPLVLAIDHQAMDVDDLVLSHLDPPLGLPDP
jgi:hypothetical protein